MAYVVDDDLIESLRGRSLRDLVASDTLEGIVKGRIGLPLARWWLRSEAIAAAGCSMQAVRNCSELPSEVGSCWIVLAQESSGQFPILCDAMLLPLKWTRGCRHSNALPASLRGLADRVVESLSGDREFAREGQQRWRLELNQRVLGSGYSLSGLNTFRFESGFASLAAGLLLAVEGGRPDCRVWASAVWADGSLGPVDHVGAKLDYARELGARAVFLPSLEDPAVHTWLTASRQSPDVRVFSLSREGSSAATVRAWLKDYSRELGMEPDRNDPMPVRCQHYFRLTSKQEKREYYCRAFLDDLAANGRGRWNPSSPSPTIKCLVTIVSRNPELVLLAAKLLEADQCLPLFFDGDKEIKGHVEWLTEKFKQLCPGIHLHPPKPIDAAKESLMTGALASAVWSHIDTTTSPSEVCFDLTPGTKLMTVAMALAAKPQSWLLYLSHRFVEQDVDPATIAPLLWQAASEK